MKLSPTKIVPWVIGAGLLFGVVYAFMPGPVPVDLATVERGSLRVTVDEDGKTRIKERYVVSAPLAGHMHRIELHPGDLVEANKTVLAVLEPTNPSFLDARALAEAEARVRSAQAAEKMAQAKLEAAIEVLEIAKHDFERARDLQARKALSQQEYDNAEHRERIAYQDLKAAQFSALVSAHDHEVVKAALIRMRPTSADSAAGDRFPLRSPVSGKVLRVLQESAAVVLPGTKLLEVGDSTDLEIEIDVLSQQAVRVKPGQKVILDHWGGAELLTGRVRLIEPAGFLKVSALGVEEQRVYVIADFDDPPSKRLSLGDAFRVEARIVIWESSDVLKVPAGALFRRGDAWAVFAVVNGRAELRIVKTGQSNGLETEILHGLLEKDGVILHPGDRVRDGVRVHNR